MFQTIEPFLRVWKIVALFSTSSSISIAFGQIEISTGVVPNIVFRVFVLIGFKNVDLLFINWCKFQLVII